MKYKKYLVFLFLIMILGCNKTYAATEDELECYYISSDNKFKANLKITYKVNDNGVFTKASNVVYIDFNGQKIDHNKEKIKNFTMDSNIYGITMNPFLNDLRNTKQCPTYLIFEYDKAFFRKTFTGGGYKVWATNNDTTAKMGIEAINRQDKTTGFYATYTNSNGSKRTAEQYYGTIVDNDIIGDDENVDCSSLFDSKNGEYSIRELVNEILQYPRIIVPILVILLGMLDLAKAVIASKEDEMKKAQQKFIKRVVIGVVIFFVPLIVNLVMDLADIVWEGLGYSSCEFQ